ncbi:MAG: hypothetical protein JW894_15835 [Bacteroidales bacterium]|nr:hypothetical protein [Bacteroidales bacterium]
MKKLVLINVFLSTGFFLITSTLNAQRVSIHENPDYGIDSASRMECAQNLSIMSQYVKIKTYEYAYDSWKFCLENCPKSSKNIYIQGAKILDYKIENAEDEESKNVHIDELMNMYDQRMVNFNEEGLVYGKKGIDLLKYRIEDIVEAYGYLEKSVDLQKDEVQDAVALTFISATYNLMQKDILGADVMISNYVKIMDHMDAKIAKGKTGRNTEQSIEGIEKIFAESGAADCESLINIFTVKYEADPENIEQLKKITTLLSETGCQESDLYAKTAEKLYKLEPSAQSGAGLANVFAIRQEYGKATEYYKKAIEQETDKEKKALYYFNLAKIQYQLKDYPTTRKYCQNALSLKSDLGEAYIIIGRAYAASNGSCGSNDFENQAVYWAAVDQFIKAKTVDPSVTETANEQINAYSRLFPNQEITFFNGYTDGQNYTVGCWINESTTVRTTK